MSIISKLEKLETDISNAYDSIEIKGGNIPQNKNTENLSDAILSVSDGGNNINFFIQDNQPESYNGIWIADDLYANYPIVIANDINSLIHSSINIVDGNNINTILYGNNISGFSYSFYQILITNENNEVVFDIPIYYGNGSEWIDITFYSTVNIFYNGKFELIKGFTSTAIGGTTNATYTVSNVLTFSGTSTTSNGLVYKFVSNEAIDFTLIKKLKITLTDTGSNDSGGVWVALEQNPDTITSYIDIINSPTKLDYVLSNSLGNYNGTVTLDTSAITGEYYILFYLNRGTGSGQRKTTIFSKMEIIRNDN